MNNTIIEKMWEKAKIQPNEEQKKAILYDDKNPLFITAAPGSGKTRVLLWRTVNLIVNHGIKPEEIYLGTFTEKAAYQLREGLKSLLGMASNLTNQHYDTSRMYLGTIHSNCNRILNDRTFSKGKMRTRPPFVFDEAQQYFHIFRKKFWNEITTNAGFLGAAAANEEINNFFGEKSASRHKAVMNSIKFFNRMSEETVHPDAVQSGDGVIKKMLKMYRFYLDSLSVNDIKRTDLSLLQQEALNVITAASQEISGFKHVIIDEYQDTNAVQEKIFFTLAKRGARFCVVGDDDQALYRFRGATVENFVDFEKRCQQYLGLVPTKVNLKTNYRSREEIVKFYTDFIKGVDWLKPGKGNGHYRVADKVLEAHRKSKDHAVIATREGTAAEVSEEIAAFVVTLKKEGKIKDYNQVAILFPYLRNNPRVKDLKEAFESRDIKVYAPRAGRFLDLEESVAVFGLFAKILGKPKFSAEIRGRDVADFNEWLDGCESFSNTIVGEDPDLKKFISSKRDELAIVTRDYEILLSALSDRKVTTEDTFRVEMMRWLSSAAGLSEKARKSLTNSFFQKLVRKRENDGAPFSVRYVVNRVTSLDWNLLDLFYQLNGFKYFRKMYDMAEVGEDEGPICNLGLITQYISRFMDNYGKMIVAERFQENRYTNTLFLSFCFSLYRLQETEYENDEDPFPKGRVSFLTIHQSKGLEFPVVVLGSLGRKRKDAPIIETVVRDLTGKEGEPLDRISLFDNMRLFYVALSRAADIMVIPRVKQRGIQVMTELKPMLDQKFCSIQEISMGTVPVASGKEENMGKSYSYTSDYLMYKKCPRNYMIFRKYGFVPSRTQTMFFGSLVHRTIEDLHNYLIALRDGAVE
jgi:DNA helicase II / ATP-dependent DNA helicase PcrA